MTLERAEQALAQLIDEHRGDCLWFLRQDYYPTELTERLAVLDAVERYGDLDAYRRARTLKEWLSQSSSAASAG
jgi:hypothetical protein